MTQPEPGRLAELAAWDVVSRMPIRDRQTTAKDILRQFDSVSNSPSQLTRLSRGASEFYRHMQQRQALGFSDIARAASSENSLRRQVGNYLLEVRKHGERSFLVIEVGDNQAPLHAVVSDAASKKSIRLELNEVFVGFIQQELIGTDGEAVLQLLSQSDSVISLH